MAVLQKRDPVDGLLISLICLLFGLIGWLGWQGIRGSPPAASSESSVARSEAPLAASFNYTPHDRDLMIRIIYGEAAHEPRLGQIGVAWVIINRLKNPYGWNSITDVVTACGYIRRKKRRVKICQFEPWLRRRAEIMALSKNHLDYRSIGALVDDVLAGRISDPTNGAWYFLNKKTVLGRRKKQKRNMPKWSKNCPVEIGRHSFCKTAFHGFEANGRMMALLVI